MLMMVAGINGSATVELRHPTADQQLVPGVEVTLRCRTDGHPLPSVEWYRNRIRYVRAHLHGTPMLRLFACPRRAYWSSACHQVYSSDQPVLHLADWEHKLLDQQPPVSRSYQVRLPPHFVRNHHLFAQECNSTNMYVCARAGAGQRGPIKALMHILLLVRTRS